jgi:hypothetical protein
MSIAAEVPAEPTPTAEPRRARILLTPGPWRTAVFAALGSVLGIVLAFGIDAWWDHRTERQKEAAYLDSLHTELVETRKSLREHMRSRSEAIALMKHYLETVGAADPRTGSVDTATWMLTQIAPFYDFAPRRAALDDLIGSGGLQLIRSDALRRALAGYEDRSTQDDAIAFWRTQMSPYLIAHANWPRTTLLNERVSPDLKPRDANFPFVADVEAFYGNRTYANLLMSRILTEGRVRQRQEGVLRSIDALLMQLSRTREPPAP